MSEREVYVNEDIMFWGNSANGGLSIVIPVFRRFLEHYGFGNVKKDSTRVLVREENKRLRLVDDQDVMNFVLEFFSSEERPEDYAFPHYRGADGDRITNKLLSNVSRYFGKMIMGSLAEFEEPKRQSDAFSSYFYFNNGYVIVTSEGITLHDYDDLGTYIWEADVIDYGIEINEDFKEHGHYYDAASKVSDRSDKNMQSFDCLATSMGYLIHDYKRPGLAKAINVIDLEPPTADKKMNGRTGKSVMFKGVKYMKSTVIEDGKQFRFGTFCWQDIDITTKIIILDDVLKKFPYEMLFHNITGGLKAEGKGMKPVYYEYVDSPKFCVITNFVIRHNDPSYTNRYHQVGFNNHFRMIADKITDDTSPITKEYGCDFYEGWEGNYEIQWNHFYNTMFHFVQLFLKKGLVSDKENRFIAKRKFLANVTEEFAEFAEDHLYMPGEYYSEELLTKFEEDYPDEFKDDKSVSTKQFTYWVKAWADNREWSFDNKKNTVQGPRDDAGNVTYMSAGRKYILGGGNVDEPEKISTPKIDDKKAKKIEASYKRNKKKNEDREINPEDEAPEL